MRVWRFRWKKESNFSKILIPSVFIGNFLTTIDNIPEKLRPIRIVVL